MRFYIYIKNGSGVGIKYHKKENFLKEIIFMIKDCIASGGTYFSVSIETDANCFFYNERNNENENLRKLWTSKNM